MVLLKNSFVQRLFPVYLSSCEAAVRGSASNGQPQVIIEEILGELLGGEIAGLASEKDEQVAVTVNG